MIPRHVTSALAIFSLFSIAGIAAQSSLSKTAGAVSATPAKQAMIDRAKALELPTPHVPPPGDPLEHHAAGFAKIIASAVFISGFEPEFAAEYLGYFLAPYAERAKLGQPVIDRVNKAVHVSLPNGGVRTAKFVGDQGCVALPKGAKDVQFTPVKVERRLPDPTTLPWPMGDVLPKEPLPAGIDQEKLRQAVNLAFATPEGMAAAFVVTWKGRIIAERYGREVTMHTPLESWSMGKSTIATLMGILIKQGVYRVEQPAPIPEWQTPGDPRAKIRILDLMQMSSGLRMRAPLDPDYDPSGPYPEHVYFYTGTVDTFRYAASLPLQWPPGAVGRYHNSDPVLINYLIRLAVEKRGENYLTFPQRALFDKLGIRTMVIETDAFGNFLTQGNDYACARDWARHGILYLQHGVWNGERLLPEGFTTFVRTVAPAWAKDNNHTYGGFFMINGDGRYPVPKDAYFMAGAGGQRTLIIPSHDLVVVRMGHFKGEAPGEIDFKNALGQLIEAVPARE